MSTLENEKERTQNIYNYEVLGYSELIRQKFMEFIKVTYFKRMT